MRGRRTQTVVVVEDDAETRELELFLLGSEGYRVVGVEDGDHAAAAVRRHRADLVLLDLMLPGKDGNAVLDELGADPSTARIPVVVLTAYPARLRRTPQVARLVRKPFDVPEFLDAAAAALAAPPAA
jgi:two-component system alkaline phosphatase synthesis response regulator PhoP